MSPASADPQVITKACIGVVEAALSKATNLSFSSPPTFVEKQIIEYDSRMRVFGLEIFEGGCYICPINFYLNEQDMKSDRPCGAFILYIGEANVGRLLIGLGHKKVDDDDPEAVLNVFADFCKSLADSFQKEMTKHGSPALILPATAQKFQNYVHDGINFHYDEYSKYEVSFYLWKEKVMVIDITMKKL